MVMKSILTLMYNRVREEFVMMDYIKQNGKLFGFSFVNSLTIVTVEPELIQSVLSKEFATFMNRRVCCFIFDAILFFKSFLF